MNLPTMAPVTTLLALTDDGPAGRWAQAIAQRLGGRLTVVAGGDEPPAALLRAADRDDVDLVVADAADGLLVQHLAHHSRRPFAVVPATAVTAPRRIVIGLDGSDGAQRAATWCAGFGPAVGAEMVAVDILDPPGFISGVHPEIEEIQREIRRELTGPWTQALVDAGVAVAAVVVEDHRPADAFLRVAAEQGADTVVVGARALTGVRLLRSDGLTMHALHHCPVPVIVVPADHGASPFDVLGWDEARLID